MADLNPCIKTLLQYLWAQLKSMNYKTLPKNIG